MSEFLAWAWVCLRRGAGVAGLCALVLATGCATVPAPPRSGEFYLQRAQRRELALSWWGTGAVESTQRDTPAKERGRPLVPEGWPQEASSDEELLAPLLACPSVADFLALQRGVGMARVVERLGDWGA